MLLGETKEDNQLHAKDIEWYLLNTFQQSGREFENHFFSSGQKLIQILEKKPNLFDIVFMDIELSNDENGITVAQRINQMNPHVQILFISGEIDWARKAGRANCIYFLKKPIDQSDFKYALNKAILNLHHQKVFFQTKGSHYSANIDDILYIERKGRTSKVIIKSEREIKTSEFVEEILLRLDQRIFCQCHKSFLVNLEHVIQITSKFFVLDNYVEIPISRSMCAATKSQYLTFLGDKI